jgi:heme/copper-type cytochrome/quinol oxidase subunit 4
MISFSVNRIWLLLLAATGVTFWLGESGLSGSAGMTPVLVMFGLAFVKALLVMQDFMELRHAPALWRRLLVGWLMLVTTGIVLAYWMGQR